MNFLLDENEINKIAKEVELCRRIRTFTPLELLKMVIFYPNIAKDILDEIYGEKLILSDKKIFHQVNYYLKRLHHYSYRVLCIFEKLKVLIPRTCLKSKRKGSVSSNEILKVVT